MDCALTKSIYYYFYCYYLNRWLEIAGVMDFENLKALIIKEQFLIACPRNAEVHLNANSFNNMR